MLREWLALNLHTPRMGLSPKATLNPNEKKASNGLGIWFHLFFNLNLPLITF
jgi:hypothetical protein